MPVIVVRQRRRRRPPNRAAAPILFVLALLAAAGAAAAGVTAHRNAARLARYGDASCGARATAVENGAVCIVDTARITDRRVHYYRNSPTYLLTLAAARAPLDTLVLELPLGAGFRTAWDSVRNGDRVPVERFNADSTRTDRQITAVYLGGTWIRTSWNPAWRDSDATAGVVFLSLIALCCLVAGLVVRRRRAAPLAT